VTPCPYFPARHYEDRQLTDPAEQIVREVPEISRPRSRSWSVNCQPSAVTVTIAPMTSAHVAAVLSVHEGIDEVNATFETNCADRGEHCRA
jgi:hypothetical protein